MTIYGYMRVSTDEQKNDLQQDALLKADVLPENLFADTITGSSIERPELLKLLAILGKGDTLMVWKLDRLGRKASYLFDLVEELKEKGIDFVALRDNFDTKTPAGWAMFQMMGVFAELERNTIRERTKEGVAAARERTDGTWGRKSSIPDRDHDKLLNAYAQGASIRKLAGEFPYSKSAIHRFIAGAIAADDEKQQEQPETFSTDETGLL